MSTSLRYGAHPNQQMFWEIKDQHVSVFSPSTRWHFCSVTRKVWSLNLYLMNFYRSPWPKLTRKLRLQCVEGGISDGRSEDIHHTSPNGPRCYCRPSTRHRFSDSPEDEAHVLNDRSASRTERNAQKHSPVHQDLVCIAYSHNWESGSAGFYPERDRFADSHLFITCTLNLSSR